MIKAKGIVKQFGHVRALDNFEMNVEKGSIYGLIGPNGAGKTTIINHLMGILRPDEGEVLINGEPVLENNEIKMLIATFKEYRDFSSMNSQPIGLQIHYTA